MGVDLASPNGSEHLNWYDWETAFNLATKHGWRPAGTVLDEGALYQIRPESEGEERARLVAEANARWSGSYFTNDLQTITEEDARQFAAALRRGGDALEASTPRDAAFFREFAGFLEAGPVRIL